MWEHIHILNNSLAFLTSRLRLLAIAITIAITIAIPLGHNTILLLLFELLNFLAIQTDTFVLLPLLHLLQLLNTLAKPTVALLPLPTLLLLLPLLLLLLRDALPIQTFKTTRLPLLPLLLLLRLLDALAIQTADITVITGQMLAVVAEISVAHYLFLAVEDDFWGVLWLAGGRLCMFARLCWREDCGWR